MTLRGQMTWPTHSSKNMTRDQASGLRMMNQPNNEKVKVIAVSGGKGGVGKTSVSINTAVALA